MCGGCSPSRIFQRKEHSRGCFGETTVLTRGKSGSQNVSPAGCSQEGFHFHIEESYLKRVHACKRFIDKSLLKVSSVHCAEVRGPGGLTPACCGGTQRWWLCPARPPESFQAGLAARPPGERFSATCLNHGRERLSQGARGALVSGSSDAASYLSACGSHSPTVKGPDEPVLSVVSLLACCSPQRRSSGHRAHPERVCCHSEASALLITSMRHWLLSVPTFTRHARTHTHTQ